MSYKNMKARKRFMAIALSGAMMLSVTGCGSTATGGERKKKEMYRH